MSTVSLKQLLDVVRERTQKGELTMTRKGWAELREIAGKRAVSAGKRAVSARHAFACARVAVACN